MSETVKLQTNKDWLKREKDRDKMRFTEHNTTITTMLVNKTTTTTMLVNYHNNNTNENFNIINI